MRDSKRKAKEMSRRIAFFVILANGRFQLQYWTRNWDPRTHYLFIKKHFCSSIISKHENRRNRIYAQNGVEQAEA